MSQGSAGSQGSGGAPNRGAAVLNDSPWPCMDGTTIADAVVRDFIQRCAENPPTLPNGRVFQFGQRNAETNFIMSQFRLSDQIHVDPDDPNVPPINTQNRIKGIMRRISQQQNTIQQRDAAFDQARGALNRARVVPANGRPPNVVQTAAVVRDATMTAAQAREAAPMKHVKTLTDWLSRRPPTKRLEMPPVI